VHAAVDLACAQAKLGHDVALCSEAGSFDALLAENNVVVFQIDQSRKPLTLATAVFKLANLVRRFKPDVVHAHMMTSAVASWPITRLFRIPLITTVHNAFEKSARLMGVGDRVIAVSKAVADSMAARGISSKRIRVILNGTVGSARLTGPSPTPKALVRPSVVCVGGLHPRKGIADLIHAFDIVRQRFPDTRLYLVGEGPTLAEYEELCRQLDCQQAVVFCGAEIDPRSYLQSTDIFVLASHFDPAPLVLSEARDAGCAIIATDVDGIPEMLDNGAAGILVPPGNPQALAEQIALLLSDPDALADYKRRSRVNIGSFSTERVAKATLDVYRECTRS
jgi:glycosyltransferase involved in cell wall biosynthesis